MRKPEELDILKRLEKLQAVVKTFRRDKAFLIRVPLRAWPEVSDEELRELMRPFWTAHPKMPAASLNEPEPPPVTDAERRFLMHVANNPHDFSTHHYNDQTLSLASGTRLRQKLHDAGYIRVHRIATGRRGGMPEIIELTESGYQVLSLTRPSWRGHGSFEHSWWAHRVRAWLEGQSRTEVIIEKLLNGKAADVGELTQSGWIAWEVQLPNSVRPDLVADLIAKDLNAGFIRVVICVLTPKDKEKVNSVVEEMERHPGLFKVKSPIVDKVQVRLLAEFVNRNGG